MSGIKTFPSRFCRVDFNPAPFPINFKTNFSWVKAFFYLRKGVYLH